MSIFQNSFRSLLLLLLALSLYSCSPVKLHQKERLNDRIMRFDSDSEASEMHGYFITPREGSIGGFTSVGAGGCSCK